jgi:hypothetical protein
VRDALDRHLTRPAQLHAGNAAWVCGQPQAELPQDTARGCNADLSVGHFMSKHIALADQRIILATEHAALEAEHERLKGSPEDLDGHARHKKRLRRHLARLRRYRARLTKSIATSAARCGWVTQSAD